MYGATIHGDETHGRIPLGRVGYQGILGIHGSSFGLSFKCLCDTLVTMTEKQWDINFYSAMIFQAAAMYYILG